MGQFLEKNDSFKGNTQPETVAKVYREQSYLWRAIALMQIPTTLVAVIVALMCYVNSDNIINVAPRPAPGYFLTSEIPDEEFVKVGIEFLNLISSYQPVTAEKQFNYALNFLMEPVYSLFRNNFLLGSPGRDPEIEQIRQIQRAQLFYINRDLISVRRYEDQVDPRNSTVEVRIPGELIKVLNGVRQDAVNNDRYLAYFVQMRTFPKTIFNPNGIYIVNYNLRTKIGEGQNQGLFGDLQQIDRKEEKAAKRKKGNSTYTLYKWR